ncbi:MAG: hypothetical protein Q4G18_01945 [Myroides sp.]|nr:hypothetical protein [Myroides sp.]
MKKRCFLFTSFFLIFSIFISNAQPIKPKVLLKKTEQSIKEIKTLAYKINKKSKFFSSKDTLNRSAVGIIKIVPKDEIGSYHKVYFNHGEKRYNQYKYDGTYSSFLYFHLDSLDISKKTTITNVSDDNFNSIKGNFVSNFILKDYFKKNNIFKQYRSLLAKIFIKDITTEESVYNGIPVYILTVYGKDKPRENRINSAIEKYYIRKSDFLPIAHSFYGEFQGMKEIEFTEIEYLEINPELSLDAFKIDPSVKEVKPRVYFEEMQKYNL